MIVASIVIVIVGTLFASAMIFMLGVIVHTTQSRKCRFICRLCGWLFGVATATFWLYLFGCIYRKYRKDVNNDRTRS